MKKLKKLGAVVMTAALVLTLAFALMPAKIANAQALTSDSGASGVCLYPDGSIADNDMSGSAILWFDNGATVDSISVSGTTVTISNLVATGNVSIWADGYNLVFSGTNTLSDFAPDAAATITVTSGSTLTATISYYAPNTLTLGTDTVATPSSGAWADFAGGTVTFSSSATPTTAEAASAAAPEAPAVPANVQAAQTVLATASVPSISSGAVVAGSGVSVAGVSPITDGAALTQMTDLAARMVVMTGSQGPVTIQTAQAMDLNATGNGRVNFQVGSQFAGKVAVIGHYHDGVLYFQQRYVKANGTVDPYFSNFSPVIVLVTNQTTALADIPTSEPGATPLSAKASSSTAPKTGESSANTIIFIIGMVALGAAIATYRKRSY